MGFLSGLFGGGSKTTTSTSNTNEQGTQSAQQSALGSQQQSQDTSALANAMQQLFGGSTQAQGYQYGLAPTGAATQFGQNYLANMLGGGYQPSGASAGAYGQISQYNPQFAAMGFNPTGTQQYQQGMGAAADYAGNMYERSTKPLTDTTYTRTGMFGSSPWAAERAKGAGDLAASLGAQGLNYASQIGQQGIQGLTSSYGPMSQLAQAQDQAKLDAYAQQMQGALGLIGSDPRAQLMGQTGQQQYGQTGQSQQQAQQTALANAILQQFGQQSGQYNKSGSSSSTTTEKNKSSLLGGLGSILSLGGSIFGGPLGGILGGLLGGGLGGGVNSEGLMTGNTGTWP